MQTLNKTEQIAHLQGKSRPDRNRAVQDMLTPSQENGSVKLMMFSPFGTLTEKMWNFLLTKLTISILQ